MKSTISLNQSSRTSVLDRISSWLDRSNARFSALMEQQITNRQMLLIVNLVLAISSICTVTFTCPVYSFVLVSWFAWSVNLCREGGIK